jgi:NADH:ubiquinone oxidoreductase subunit F (NADH-binding)
MRAPRQNQHQSLSPSGLKSAPAALPRLLLGLDDNPFSSLNLDGHLEAFGTRTAHPARLIKILADSGLRGRGGAGFPTAKKMQAVASQGRKSVVVANGVEAEPLVEKDMLLLSRQPHLVLDGCALAAEAVGATQVIVCIKDKSPTVIRSLEAAVLERRRSQLDHVGFSIETLPDRYLAGEESALIRWLNGKELKPAFVGPRPFERGVSGRPTLVQNAETLAQIALIARFGADWFRELGTPVQPGSVLVTVSGAVGHAGVYEMSIGTVLGDLVEAAGGLSDAVGAFLVGGYFGGWIDSSTALDLPLTDQALKGRAALGTGAIVALPESGCGIAQTAEIVAFLAQQRARQCGPCTHGLRAISDALSSLAYGRDWPDVIDHLRRFTHQVRGRGACHHPDGAVGLVESALEVFRGDVEMHLRRGPCSGARPGGRLGATGLGWQ